MIIKDQTNRAYSPDMESAEKDQAKQSQTVSSIPVGGSTGQVLAKASSADGDVVWKTSSGGSGGAVDTVNTVAPDGTGNITLTQDDITDGSTYKKYSTTEKTKLAGIAIGAQVNTSKVKASETDTTEGYLGDKLVAGANVTITKNNSGANETYTIASSGSGSETVVFADIASKPTTVAGYGITDGVTLTGAETLTNKTLASPVFTGNLGTTAYAAVIKSGSGDVIFKTAGDGQVGQMGHAGITVGSYEKNAFAQFNGTTGAVQLKFANTATGKATTDAFDVGILADGTAEIRQRENLPLNIYTNNTLVAAFSEAGVTSNLSGTWSTISDERLKENIVDVSEPIAKIESIAKCVKHYNFINQNKYAKGLRTGYIAQLLAENGLEGHVTQRKPNDEEEGILFGWTYKDEEYEDIEGEKTIIKTRRVVDKEGEMILGIENNFTPYLFPAFVALLERVKKLEELL